jgi:hypothetical protein
MILNQAIFTDEALMLSTKLGNHLFWMTVAKDLWYLETFFYLLFDMLVGTKLYGFLITLMCTMIRVTERAVKLAFDDKFFAFTLNHFLFHTFSAGSFVTAFHINRLSVFEIVEMLAEGALKV